MRRSGFSAIVLATLVLAAAASAEEIGVTPLPSGPDTAAGASVHAQVTVVPLAVQGLVARDAVGVGRPLPVRAEIRNLSQVAVAEVTAEIRVASSVVVADDTVQQVGEIPPLERDNVSWRICATTPGAVVGVIRVQGLFEDGTAFTTESPAFVLVATDARGPRRC